MLDDSYSARQRAKGSAILTPLEPARLLKAGSSLRYEMDLPFHPL